MPRSRPGRCGWSGATRPARCAASSAIRCAASRRVIAVSERDAVALRQAYALPRVEAIETGVDTEFYAYHAPDPAPAGGGTVVFTGSMDSRSNIDGIEFLMDEVWPLVLAAPARRPGP